MRIAVTVSPDDIARGCRFGANENEPGFGPCPVLLAIRRAMGAAGLFPHRLVVSTAEARIKWRIDTRSEAVSLPRGVLDRIRRYDLHGTMEPFRFGLEVEAPGAREWVATSVTAEVVG